MFPKNINLSFKVGLALATVHLLIFLGLFLEGIISDHYAAGMALVMFMPALDFFLVPIYNSVEHWFSLSMTQIYLPELLVYGVLGTLSWLFIPVGIGKIIKRLTRPKVKALFSPSKPTS